MSILWSGSASTIQLKRLSFDHLTSYYKNNNPLRTGEMILLTDRDAIAIGKDHDSFILIGGESYIFYHKE